MTQYNLRGVNGALKAVIPSRIALEIIGVSKGKWESIPCGQIHTLQFHGAACASCTIPSNDGPILLVFLSGDTIDIST